MNTLRTTNTMADDMQNTEYRLKIEDFEQLLGSLATFDTTLEMSSCAATIGTTETTMFNKWTSGKSDLFTSSLRLADAEDPDTRITMFIPNLKKLIVVMKNIGKYYDIKDTSLFSETDGKVKMFVCSKASYVRIASPKYSIKFQLSTSAVMESQIGQKVEKVYVPSKYGEVLHRTSDPDSLQSNFLLTANVGSGKFSEVNELLSTLSESSECSIKIQIPEQAKIESDVNPNPAANTLYATVADNQKLVKSNIGNKVSVEFGRMTYAAEDYLDRCCMTSTTENFVFLCSKEILDLLSSTCRSFTTASKAKDIEIVISKPNLIHLNLTMTSQNAKSEIYVTVIGTKASAMF